MQLSKVFIGSVEMEKVDAADNNLLNSSRISALNYSKWQQELHEDQLSGQKGMGTLMVRRIGNGEKDGDEEYKGQGSPLKSFGQNLNQTLDLSRVEDQFGFDDDSMLQMDS